MTMVPRFDKPARTLRTLWIFVVLALALVLGANFLASGGLLALVPRSLGPCPSQWLGAGCVGGVIAG